MRSVIILSGILLSLVASELRTQQQRTPVKLASDTHEDVIRINTSLVTLPVRVNDRRRKVVYGLRREQFQVFENGVAQDIVYFEPPNLTDGGDNVKPLAIALMLDVSDSTELKLARIKLAALAFIDLLRSGDRVIVVSFDRQTRVLTEATDDRETLRAAIKQLKSGGGTSLYGALNEVISQSLASVAGRKAIVLLTDGVDTTSKLSTFDSSIQAAEISDVAIFPIQYHTYSDFSDNPSRETYTAGSVAVAHVTLTGEFASQAYKRATLYLRLLADKTAGRFQFADSSRNLARSFETIATQLREQYTLGYYPKSKVEERRQIEVKVLVPETTVRTRKTYLYRPLPTVRQQ